MSLFAQRNGLRAIAEGGPVSIQAHTDALAVLADQAVTVTSSTESIEILAQRNIVLRGGDSVIRMEGSAITFETIKLSVKGAGIRSSGREDNRRSCQRCLLAPPT